LCGKVTAPIEYETREREVWDKAKRDNLWHQLDYGTQRVTSEDRVIWTIFSIFFAANAVLLRSVFTGTETAPWTPAMVVGGFGFAMSLVWFFVQRRAFGHLRAWETIVRKLEDRLGIPADVAFSHSVNQQYRDALPCPRARCIMCLTPLVLALLWLVLMFILC
jgi:fatty acid desaturase